MLFAASRAGTTAAEFAICLSIQRRSASTAVGSASTLGFGGGSGRDVAGAVLRPVEEPAIASVAYAQRRRRGADDR
jgi:hypothetical protein